MRAYRKRAIPPAWGVTDCTNAVPNRIGCVPFILPESLKQPVAQSLMVVLRMIVGQELADRIAGEMSARREGISGGRPSTGLTSVGRRFRLMAVPLG
jgi:hypothetical protein